MASISHPVKPDHILQWIFTLGLSVSSAVDIVITGLLFYLFQLNKPDAGQWVRSLKIVKRH
jgi:hypothetical protein